MGETEGLGSPVPDDLGKEKPADVRWEKERVKQPSPTGPLPAFPDAPESGAKNSNEKQTLAPAFTCRFLSRDAAAASAQSPRVVCFYFSSVGIRALRV